MSRLLTEKIDSTGAVLGTFILVLVIEAVYDVFKFNLSTASQAFSLAIGAILTFVVFLGMFIALDHDKVGAGNAMGFALAWIVAVVAENIIAVFLSGISGYGVDVVGIGLIVLLGFAGGVFAKWVSEKV